MFFDNILESKAANIVALSSAVIGIGYLLKDIFKQLIKRLTCKDAKEPYSLVWKRSTRLEPHDIMLMRSEKNLGYNDFYFERPHDNEIKRRLADGRHVLIMGQPLSGKTRAVFQALKYAENDYYVTMPDETKINGASYAVPGFWSLLNCIKKRRILFLDDIQKYTQKEKLISLLDEFNGEDVVIVATCRRGEEEREFLNDDLEFFFGEAITIPSIEASERERLLDKLGEETGLDIPKRFDGNIGTVFLPLDIMKKRFQKLGEEKRNMLLSLQRLRSLGVHRGLYEFEVSWALSVYCNIYGEEKHRGQHRYPEKYDLLLTELDDNGFIRRVKSTIRMEETYLESIVSPVDVTVQDFKNAIPLFNDDPEVLISLAKKAIRNGETFPEKESFMTVAIEALERALGTGIAGDTYAKAKNNLGNAYSRRSEVRGSIDDLETAITCYRDDLEVSTFHRFPREYAITQNNLGNAYANFAGYREPVENLERAISAYEEVLKVSTLERTPMDYAMTQNNLGGAYSNIAGYLEPVENLERAVRTYEEALKVYTLERTPMEYATTQNNLGAVYRNLAGYREPVENLDRAVRAYEEALEVYTLERTPMDYAMTQNNLGTAYRNFAGYRDSVEDLERAVRAYEEALKVYTLERTPMDYAVTQNNLGTAYINFAVYRDPVENLERAGCAFEESLKVYTRDQSPIHYARTMGILAATYGTLARGEVREEYCLEAWRCLSVALDIYTEKEFPLDYQRMMRIQDHIEKQCSRVRNELM